MLHLVRKHQDSWLIKAVLWTIVFAFIATIFYAWGMGGTTGGASGVVARVNGEEIYFNEYDKAFNNMVALYRDQFRDQFSDQLIDRLNLRGEALDQLILSKLLIEEAERRNIRVSDAELADRISSFPAFQKDKTFDSNLYQNYLNYQRTSAREFEETLRDQMRREKLEDFIKANTPVAPSELDAAFRRENDKVKFSYITFTKDYFEKTTEPTDEDLQKFFDAHKKEFLIPERINVQFVRLAPKMLEETIEIREEDIAEYYELNQAQFHVKKQYQARHILFRVNPVIGDDEDAKKKATENEKETKAKAEDLLKKIREGASFEEMAKQHSDDKVSGNNGGDLGQFSAGTMVTEFETALDKLKPGEVSEPVKTTFGYHLIRMDQVTPARVKPKDEVKEEIVKKLKTEKGKLRILRHVRKIHEAVQGGKDLAAAASEAGFEVNTTGLISKKDHTVPQVGVVPEFFNLAFTLKDGVVSEPLNTPEASFLLKVIERKAPEEPSLESVKTEVLLKYKEEQSKEATRLKFESLAKKLAAFKDLDQLAKDLKLEVLETPFFSRADSIPGIGNIDSIKDSVFTASTGDTTSGESRFGYYLIKVKEFQKAETPDAKQLQDLYERLRIQRGAQMFRNWLEKVREKADIQIDQSLLGTA